MKFLLRIMALIVLLACGGCVVREGHGGGDDHYWHGYGHGDHWEHEHGDRD